MADCHEISMFPINKLINKVKQGRKQEHDDQKDTLIRIQSVAVNMRVGWGHNQVYSHN